MSDWLGLAGVALGAAMTYLATFLTENRRWKREREVRFEQERVSIYCRFIRLCGEIAEGERASDTADDLRGREKELRESLGQMRVLSSPPVLAAATTLFGESVQAGRIRSRDPDLATDETDAQVRFLAAVWQELKLPHRDGRAWGRHWR